MWNAFLLAVVLPALPQADRLHGQAAAYFEAGRCRDAARAEQRAFSLWSQLPGLAPAALIPLHSNLAEMYACAGRLTDADRHATHALDLITTDCPACLGEKANALSVRAKVAYATGHMEDALALRRQVIHIWQVIPGEPVHLAVAISNLGWLLGARSDYAGARERFDSAARILRDAGRQDHVQLGRILLNRGLVCLKQGDLEQADRDYLDAIAILTARLGPSHPEAVLAQGERAVLLRKMGRKQEAKALEAQTGTVRRPTPEVVDVLALRGSR